MSDLTSNDRATNQSVWCLTDQKINDLQVASIDRLIERCKAAHFTNIRIRINGQWEDHEADWIKHLRRVTEPTDMAQLMSFYGAATLEDLVARQAHHIEKLQAKLPATPAMGAERVREG